MSAILGPYLLGLRMLRGRGGENSAAGKALLLGVQGEEFLRQRRRPFGREEAPLCGLADYVNGLSVKGLLAQGTAFANSHPQKEALIRAYLKGLLCHRAYSEAIGPFLRAALSAYKQLDEPVRAMELDGDLPARVEAVFDILLLRYETGKLPFEVSLKETWPKEPALWRDVSQLYAKGLAGREDAVETQTVFEAMENRRRWMRLLNNRTTFKRSALGVWEGLLRRKGAVTARMHPLTEPDGFDYANVEAGAWQDPLSPGEERHESLFDRFEQAVETAGRWMDTYI